MPQIDVTLKGQSELQTPNCLSFLRRAGWSFLFQNGPCCSGWCSCMLRLSVDLPEEISFIHQLFIYSPFWGHMFLENHRKICSLWVLSSLVWCEQTGEQSFRKAFLKSRMEKGFSKSAPKLWCFSSRVWKFQNHSGAVVSHKLLDSEEFGDFLLCRLFVLMDNLLFQGGCGGNPNWCIKTSTVWKIMQIWSRICRTAALVGLITNWANHKLGW